LWYSKENVNREIEEDVVVVVVVVDFDLLSYFFIRVPDPASGETTKTEIRILF